MNPLIQKLFNQSPTAASPYISKGSLVMFRYGFWIHDPNPLVIVTDYVLGGTLRGVNLHYLTFNYIKNLMTSGSLQSISYQNIKQDSYIVGAFRSYKGNGISGVRKFDASFVLKMMSIANNFDPTQIHAIRQSVEQQLQQQYIPKADNLNG